MGTECPESDTAVNARGVGSAHASRALWTMALLVAIHLPLPRGFAREGVLASLLLYGMISSALFVVGGVVVCRLLRVPVDEVGIGMGPAVLLNTWGGTRWRVNSIPLGSYFHQRGEGDLHPVGSGKTITGDGREYHLRHALVRVGIVVTGPLTMFLLGATLIGPTEAMAAATRFLTQFWDGVLAPGSRGALHWRSALVTIRDLPFLTGLGLVAAKMAVWNLMPIPLLAGGQAILELLQWRGRNERLVQRLLLIGLLVMLASLGAWAWGLYVFCAGDHS